MKNRDFIDRFKAKNQHTHEIVMLLKMKKGVDVERIESQYDVLKECDSEFLLRYIDIVKKNDELWVITA